MMRRLLMMLIGLVALTGAANARSLAPMQTTHLMDGLDVYVPCQTAAIPYTLQQCIIYQIRLPGDTVDIKKFTFDTPKKVQYQAQEVGFILRVSSSAPISHLAFEVPSDVPVRWIGVVPPRLITVPGDTVYDISFVSHDGGSHWEGSLKLSDMVSPQSFRRTPAYGRAVVGSGNTLQQTVPNTYRAVQTFGNQPNPISQGYAQYQQMNGNEGSYYAP